MPTQGPTRDEVMRRILKLSDGTVVAEEDFVKQVDGFSMRDIAAMFANALQSAQPFW